MSTQGQSRREFLVNSVSGLGAAWVAAHYSGIVEAAEYVEQAARSGQPTKFEFFTPEQAAEVEAMAAQIIPTDDTPGAREARVIYFIDRALTTFDKDKQQQYVKGVKELQAKQKKLFKNSAKFSSLSSDDQIKVLKSIEKTPFFETVRVHT